ncbi:MAG: argininosuccinate lyase [Proteobacteria bacterium]|nr:argininosuccinate lyase [Pseudomonadota bacterium]
MSEQFPAQNYKDNVLADSFEDAKRYFLPHYLTVDRAHAIMLAERNIISDDDAASLLRAIRAVDVDKVYATSYDGTVEDLFFFLQREIAAHCGDADVAGKLHTARSRNDIDVTIYRLYLREHTIELMKSSIATRDTFLDLAANHHDSLMPAYTHTQPAQPSTVAHFLLAMAENMGRDIRRLQRAYDNLNYCPLGACAITTTGFPIDRHRVAELLGFAGPTLNSYASIASVDYFTELMGAVAAMLINTGKFAQEFLLMAMMEFDVIRLSDGYVQSSSIMPQKRNPVALEHVRAIASKALGQSLGVMTSVHNTPFGDINDVEDDLQPLIYSALRDANRAQSLLGSTLGAATFNLDILRKRADDNFITVTELADTIVRRDGLPFSIAHKIVARCVREAHDTDGRISYSTLQYVANEESGKQLSLSEDETMIALSARNFVDVRSIHGGCAPVETQRALGIYRNDAADDQTWMTGRQATLQEAAALLEQLVAQRAGG